MKTAAQVNYSTPAHKTAPRKNCYKLPGYTGEASLTMEEFLDYHPFASKAEALMYIMNNGVRSVVSCCTFKDQYCPLLPMTITQSESIMKFTIFASKQLNPSIPSLTQIKGISLPQYSPPEKVRNCYTQ